MHFMTTTLSAVYEEDGRLRLERPLPLPTEARVLVTVETGEADDERALWLAASERTLGEAWDNSEDDVFNALLQE